MAHYPIMDQHNIKVHGCHADGSASACERQGGLPSPRFRIPPRQDGIMVRGGVTGGNGSNVPSEDRERSVTIPNRAILAALLSTP
jgi:hypothetical protein